MHILLSNAETALLQGHSKIPTPCPKMYPLSLSSGWYELSDPCKGFSRDIKAETENKKPMTVLSLHPLPFPGLGIIKVGTDQQDHPVHLSTTTVAPESLNHITQVPLEHLLGTPPPPWVLLQQSPTVSLEFPHISGTAPTQIAGTRITCAGVPPAFVGYPPPNSKRLIQET